jgi:signal transduction histidine kinase
VDLGTRLRHVAGLETRLPVAVRDGEALLVEADQEQLDQALINLVANAVDAALHTGGGVEAHWRREGDNVVLIIDDEGPGLADGGNLFVPFYTTKPDGSGIGLVLSQHIAENHGGSLTLENRAGRTGARARLSLPAS